jgi:methylaspartate mutase sigma subunit
MSTAVVPSPPTPSVAATGRRVIVSSTASDSHTWNLVFLQLLLEECGHDVVNLGACVPDDLLVEQCRSRKPDLVVLSSVNGHGFQDGLRVVAALRGVPELADTPIVIGGKLGVGGAKDEYTRQLLDAGYDMVAQDTDEVDRFRSFITSLPAGAQSCLP